MDTNKFVNRHVGISAEDIPAMLETIGVKSLDELIDQTIPANIRLKEPLNLPEAMTEREFAEHIAELASKNEVFTSYIGMGWYDTVCPAPIQRNVFENPVWYTSYTPYQHRPDHWSCFSTLHRQWPSRWNRYPGCGGRSRPPYGLLLAYCSPFGF